MKKLGILRHAKSAWGSDIQLDHDRYLAERGLNQANALSHDIDQLGIIPDRVIVSSAKRTIQTWELLRENPYLKDTQWQIEEKLYLASTDDIFNILGELPSKITEVIIVGHNPTCTDFAQQMLEDDSINLATCNFLGITIKSNDWHLKYKHGKQLFFWQP